MAADGGEARELRALIRDWRRGRATATLWDVLSDYYIGLFGVVMVGAMLGNVVLGMSREADRACLSLACVTARSWLPWLVAGVAVALLLGLARLLGPVSAPPAAVSWLASSPVDRADLLRPQLRIVLVAGAALSFLAGLPVAMVAGLPAWAVACLAAAGALAGVAAVGFAADSQQRETGGPALVALGLAGAVWLALLGVVYGWWPPLTGATASVLAPSAAVLATAAAVAGVRRARRGLATLDSRRLSASGRLSANLSGALAGLDLALAYDVVVAHRSRQRGGVRPVRGGRHGRWALLRRDLLRVRRSPWGLLLLAGSVVAPYAVARAGGGVATILVAVMALWPPAASQLLALRVLTRGRSLLNLLPHRDWVSRGQTILVPGGVCLAAGLAATPAVREALAATWAESLVLAAGIGVAALASAVRWIGGRPPDYRVPMVSTPAGAVPGSAIAALMRGFDVALLASVPMLVSPDVRGAVVSLVVSAITVAVHLGRRD